MTAFELLGLDAGAGAADIKRAYARKLHQTRPEDDPEGFQRLHAAYRAALQQCRDRSEGGDAPSASTVHEADTPATVPATGDDDVPAGPPPAQPAKPAAPASTPQAMHVARPRRPVDPENLAGQVVAHACSDTPDAFRAWLQRFEPLWDLQLKNATGLQAMRRLYRTTPPMSWENQALLLQFFDLDHALAGHDPLALTRLRRRMRLAWEMRPEHREQLASRLRPDDRRPVTRQKQLSIATAAGTLLRRPYSPRRLLAYAALHPSRPSAVRAFILEASDGDPESMPPDIDRRQLGFWLDAGNARRVSGARVRVLAIRSILLAAFAALWYAVCLLLGPSTFGSDAGARFMGGLISLGLLGLVALWWLWLGWQGLEQWQIQPEPLPVAWPWLCLGFLPLAAASGLVLSLSGTLTLIPGLLLLMLAFGLALRRYLVRRQSRFAKSTYWVRILAWFILANSATHIAEQDIIRLLAPALALVTVGLWTADLLRHRHVLRVLRPARHSA